MAKLSDADGDWKSYVNSNYKVFSDAWAAQGIKPSDVVQEEIDKINENQERYDFIVDNNVAGLPIEVAVVQNAIWILEKEYKWIIKK